MSPMIPIFMHNTQLTTSTTTATISTTDFPLSSIHIDTSISLTLALSPRKPHATHPPNLPTPNPSHHLH